jgi:hypothetical protein
VTDGLSASRLSLESDRKKALADIATVDQEIADIDARKQILTARRDFLQAQADQYTEGIDALRAAQSGSQPAPVDEPEPAATEETSS